MSVTVLHRPPPTRTARYRLQRAGLIGLYEYENQTFEFEHGRLLLRGPNGSGIPGHPLIDERGDSNAFTLRSTYQLQCCGAAWPSSWAKRSWTG